jgi:hypothetical protein
MPIKSSRFSHMHCSDSSYYYVPDLNQWLPKNSPLLQNYDFQSYIRCHSLRAFRKRLQNCPKNVEFTLISLFIGPFDITGIGTKYE